MATDEIETLLQEIKAEANESDKKLPPTVDLDIPEEISQIQNKFVLICNDLHETKTNIRDRLDIVDKTELIMNLLNYKRYEVRYEFTEKLNELAEKRKQIEKDVTGNESQIALGLVDINKEIKACEQFYDDHFQTIKHQKLIMDEVALEDRCLVKLTSRNSNEEEERGSPELPWCVLCNNDAKYRCLDCSGDLYCSKRNTEVHKTWGETDHEVVPYKPH